MKLMLLLLFTGTLFASQPLTTELNGTELTYTYENGMAFNLKYTAEGILYRALKSPNPEKWWGPFPYKAFKMENGEYFLGWYEEKFGDQITQLVNLDKKTVYGSGIIVKRGKQVINFFEKANITEIVKKP